MLLVLHAPLEHSVRKLYPARRKERALLRELLGRSPLHRREGGILRRVTFATLGNAARLDSFVAVALPSRLLHGIGLRDFLRRCPALFCLFSFTSQLVQTIMNAATKWCYFVVSPDPRISGPNVFNGNQYPVANGQMWQVPTAPVGNPPVQQQCSAYYIKIGDQSKKDGREGSYRTDMPSRTPVLHSLPSSNVKQTTFATSRSRTLAPPSRACI